MPTSTARPRVSHGVATRCLQIGPYIVTEARYAANQRIPRHEHALPSWTLIVSGAVEEEFRHDTIGCGAGSLLIKPSTADHQNCYGPDGARCLLVELDVENGDAGTGPLSPVRPRSYGGTLIATLSARLCRDFTCGDPLRRLAIEETLLELGAALARTDTRCWTCGRKWLNEVREQLEAEFRSPPLLSELARNCGRHPAYVCQEFHRVFGTTIGEYVRQVRFEWAREALRAGTRSLSAIALAAGFSDQAHFTRDVRRRTGMAPRILAASMRGRGAVECHQRNMNSAPATRVLREKKEYTASREVYVGS